MSRGFSRFACACALVGLVEDQEDVVRKFDPEMNGNIWISMRRIREVTGVRLDLDSDIAFEPR